MRRRASHPLKQKTCTSVDCKRKTICDYGLVCETACLKIQGEEEKCRFSLLVCLSQRSRHQKINLGYSLSVCVCCAPLSALLASVCLCAHRAQSSLQRAWNHFYSLLGSFKSTACWVLLPCPVSTSHRGQCRLKTRAITHSVSSKWIIGLLLWGLSEITVMSNCFWWPQVNIKSNSDSSGLVRFWSYNEKKSIKKAVH